MKADINNPYFIDKFLVSNEAVSKKKVFWGWVILISCVVLYIIAIVVQARFTSGTNLSGIIAQLQVLFSVSMVVGTVRPSYVIAFSLNLINAAIVTISYIRIGDASILPGVIVPIITIIILATI